MAPWTRGALLIRRLTLDDTDAMLAIKTDPLTLQYGGSSVAPTRSESPRASPRCPRSTARPAANGSS